MELEFNSSTTFIEDVTLPSLLTSFSTSTTSSVEFTTSESESETTRLLPIKKQNTDNYKYKGPIKSYSLVDLTTIKSFKPLIREDSAIYSTETLTSAMTTRTDSGIHHSNSCLTSGGKTKKKYAHVESKVKQYIKDIKENEAKSKAIRHNLQPSTRIQQVDKYIEEMIKTEDDEIINLKNNLKKLEIQLLEKNRLIEQLQYNYKLMENKYNSATNIILKLAKPSREVLKFTKNELIEKLSPGSSIPPPKEVWGHGYKLKSSNTLSEMRTEKENIRKVRKVKSGGDLINYSNMNTYKTLRDSRSAIQKVKLWQESLASTDVSEMDTDQEVEFQSPHSCSISSNDLSLRSLEITPTINNKYPNKHECRSDSSGCGMSSTRVSKENTLVSGINMIVDNNKLCCPLINHDFETAKLHSSTPLKNIEPTLCSTPKIRNSNGLGKQNNEMQKRHSSKKYKRTKSKTEEQLCTIEADEFMCQFKHCIGVINGVVTKMEQSFMSQS